MYESTSHVVVAEMDVLAHKCVLSLLPAAPAIADVLKTDHESTLVNLSST